MKLVEIENFISIDDIDGIYPMNPRESDNTTLYDIYKNPKLLQMTKDIIDVAHQYNMNYGFTKEEMLNNAEPLQGMTYTGDRFIHHYDSYPSKIRDILPLGQRILTGIVYLSDNFDGGHTNFPKAGYDITPKKNKLLLFTNVIDDTLDLDPITLHRSTPVSNGYKSIFNVWFSEKPLDRSSITFFR